MSYEMRLITWLDASGSDQGKTWVTLSEAQSQKMGEIQSVGFVVHEDEELVTIVQSMDGFTSQEQQVDHFLTIPKFAIRKSKVVK